MCHRLTFFPLADFSDYIDYIALDERKCFLCSERVFFTPFIEMKKEMGKYRLGVFNGLHRPRGGNGC